MAPISLPPRYNACIHPVFFPVKDGLLWQREHLDAHSSMGGGRNKNVAMMNGMK